MQAWQGKVLHSLVAVQTFLNAHADRLGAIMQSSSRKSLDELVTELLAQEAAQSGGAALAKGATSKKDDLSKTLVRDHLRKLVGIAKANLQGTPELEAFRMPRGKLTVDRLFSAAQGMAAAAAANKDVFTAAGMPADFIEQLTAAAQAMVSVVDERTQHQGKRTGATSGIKSAASRGRAIVKAIDGFVQSALKDDPVLLANWETVKHIRRAATPAPSDQPAAPGTSQPVPQPGPATSAVPAAVTAPNPQHAA
jgi:hypothetical protein